MDKATAKLAITTLADMIHMRVMEFGPVDTGYKSLILSYTDQMVKGLADLVSEFGDDSDRARLAQVSELVVESSKSATVRVVTLSQDLTSPAVHATI